MTKQDESIFYELDARAESGATLTEDQARQMLPALLADRFHLKIHRESRELSVYALVVGKNGPKLSSDGRGICGSRTSGFMTSVGAGFRLFASCAPNTSLVQLAELLARETDRPVVDQTGLTGGYAFKLQWTEDTAPVQSDSAPSFFTAVQEQLGLRLDPQRAMTDVLVIDHADPPSPN
jgi:uncharacterized protein (TIGR03435 family)